MSAHTASSRSSATRRLFVGFPGNAPLWLPFPATYVRSRNLWDTPLASCEAIVELSRCGSAAMVPWNYVLMVACWRTESTGLSLFNDTTLKFINQERICKFDKGSYYSAQLAW